MLDYICKKEVSGSEGKKKKKRLNTAVSVLPKMKSSLFALAFTSLLWLHTALVLVLPCE